MSDVSRIVSRLEDRLDERGVVTDPVLARRIVCRDFGSARAVARVILRPPASDRALAALVSCCKEVFGVPPPRSLVELYELTDGLWATSREHGKPLENPLTTDYARGIRPIRDVINALYDTGVFVADPAGDMHGDTMAVLPIVDSDADWIGLESWGARGGEWPVVYHAHDNVDLGLSPCTLAKQMPVIDTSFTRWLERWIDAGFNLRLEPEEDYAGEASDVQGDKTLYGTHLPTRPQLLLADRMRSLRRVHQQPLFTAYATTTARTAHG